MSYHLRSSPFYAEFKHMDVDKSGDVSFEEYRNFQCTKRGLPTTNTGQDSKYMENFKEIDAEGNADGSLQPNEYLLLPQRLDSDIQAAAEEEEGTACVELSAAALDALPSEAAGAASCDADAAAALADAFADDLCDAEAAAPSEL
eukprot:tig00020510_g9921.t1